MKCPQCNTELRNGAKFCDECGFRLSVGTDTESFPLDDGKETSTSFPLNVDLSKTDELLSIPVVGLKGIDVDQNGEEIAIEDLVYHEGDENRPLTTKDTYAQNEEEPSSSVDANSYADTDSYIDPDSCIDPDSYIDPDITADFSSAETLIATNYEPPQSKWGSGNTVKMPQVENNR